MKTAKCRSCGADILWVSSLATGRLMPVDAEVSEKGNIMVNFQNNTAEILPSDTLAAAQKDGGRYRLNHFATCPNAKSHRKEKA